MLLDPQLESVHAVHMAWMQRAAGTPLRFNTNQQLVFSCIFLCTRCRVYKSLYIQNIPGKQIAPDKGFFFIILFLKYRFFFFFLIQHASIVLYIADDKLPSW